MKAEFVKMLADIGDPRFQLLADTLENTPPEVSVRLNPLKDGEGTSVARESSGRVAWWPQGGAYLATRPRFTLDPALHQGRYYVQDASSMVTAAVARAISRTAEFGNGTTPLLWLDACAAPGGKSTAALDGLPAGSLVVANEYDYGRAEILKENLAKWGNPATVVSRGDTARFSRLDSLFDVVAVDAPCSGEGMMRKDLTAREQWSPSLVEECCSRQREILDNLWGCLRPGGFLVYSTCTFNLRENELMVDWLRKEYGAETVDLPIEGGMDGEVAVDGVAPTRAMRFIPGRIKGEGLFMAVLRKPGRFTPAILDDSLPKRKTKGNRKSSQGNASRKATKSARCSQSSPSASSTQISQQSRATLLSWLAPAVREDYEMVETHVGLSFFPSRWGDVLPLLLDSLDVISVGVEAVEVKGKDLIPTQQLALSAIISREAFPCVEVGEKEAVDYLARESVTLPDGVGRGFVLLTFGGYPLGFVKNLGNRANNLYPKEWRVRFKN